MVNDKYCINIYGSRKDLHIDGGGPLLYPHGYTGPFNIDSKSVLGTLRGDLSFSNHFFVSPRNHKYKIMRFLLSIKLFWSFC
jgi:hypothetical protein